jgi:hypothetical protein
LRPPATRLNRLLRATGPGLKEARLTASMEIGPTCVVDAPI